MASADISFLRDLRSACPKLASLPGWSVPALDDGTIDLRTTPLEGIGVSRAGRLTHIMLSLKGLEGSLPESIGQCSELQVVWL